VVFHFGSLAAESVGKRKEVKKKMEGQRNKNLRNLQQ